MNMLICGIDPGLQRTGYALLDVHGQDVPGQDVPGQNVTIVEAGVLTTDNTADLSNRLRSLSDDLRSLFSEHHIALVSVESLYAHYKHPRTAVLMGHARGLILAEAIRAGARVVEVSATQVKRSLTGNGHAGKQQVQRVVTSRLGLSQTPEPPDVADALAIALCAVETHRVEQVLTR